MKIIIYNPDGIVSPLMYAVAKEKLNDGEEVIVVECDGNVKGCSYNLIGSKLVCNYCIKKREKCKKNLSLNYGSFETIKINTYFESEDIRVNDFKKFSEYQNYFYKEVDVGYASISTVVNDFREYKIEKFNEFQKKTLINIFRNCHQYVNACEKILETYKPDLVVLFNGRLISTRPMVRFCHKKNIEFKVYEVCNQGGDINVFDNALPHDSHVFLIKSLSFWNGDKIGEKEDLAEKFFINKRNGVFINDTVYTDRQNVNELDLKVDKNKRNIVVFNSSQDELVAIGYDFATGIFNSQSEAIKGICETLEPSLFHIYLRIHPNLDGVNSDDLLSLMKLAGEYPNLSVILPNAPTSSYLLLDIADVILTFGSTLGVEATYWGKPSILLNKAIWGDHDVAYKPSSKSELFNLLINSSTLIPKKKESTYPIAHYWSQYGRKQMYFSGSYQKGHFLAGKSCQPSLIYKVFYVLYKVSNQIKSGNKLYNRKLLTKANKILRFRS